MAGLADQIWTIANKPENKDGFTVYVYGLNKPKKGYCVAYIDTQDSHGKEGLETAIEHAKTHAQIVGGWYNQAAGSYYFDSVRVYHTEVAAREAAYREDQIGYYDFSKRGGGYVGVRDEESGKLLSSFQKPRYRRIKVLQKQDI